MKLIEIDCLDLPGVAVYAHLTEAQLRNRLEPEKGVFIVESEKVIRVALAAGYQPLSFLSENKYIDTQVRAMCEEYGVGEEVPVYTAEREVLAQLTGYELTRGVLCAMRRPTERTVEEVLSPLVALPSRCRVAVMDGVVNSTNTGAIFRASTCRGLSRPGQQAEGCRRHQCRACPCRCEGLLCRRCQHRLYPR